MQERWQFAFSLESSRHKCCQKFVIYVSVDVLNALTCPRVVCNEGGGNSGCYQPQSAKMQIDPETFFRHLGRCFAPWALSMANLPKTREGIFMPPASLLPGPVLGAAGPLSHSVHCCGFPQAYAQGPVSLAMPTPAGLWFLHTPFPAFFSSSRCCSS